MKNHPSDADLLTAISAGDLSALDALYGRYSAILQWVIFEVLHDTELTRDTLQDLFLDLARKAGLYRADKSSVKTWLNSMARNLAIDRLRSVKRRGELMDEALKLGALDPFVSREPVGADEIAILNFCMTSLKERSRQVVKMTYFDGFTMEETANRLNEPLGTVKGRIRRGVAKLRTLYHNATAPAF